MRTCAASPFGSFGGCGFLAVLRGIGAVLGLRDGWLTGEAEFLSRRRFSHCWRRSPSPSRLRRAPPHSGGEELAPGCPPLFAVSSRVSLLYRASIERCALEGQDWELAILD